MEGGVFGKAFSGFDAIYLSAVTEVIDFVEATIDGGDVFFCVFFRVPRGVRFPPEVQNVQKCGQDHTGISFREAFIAFIVDRCSRARGDGACYPSTGFPNLGRLTTTLHLDARSRRRRP